MKPLCIDLYCGLGGWTEGFLAEGWDVIGFDIEQHVYGEHRYPAQLVLQDVLSLHGRQLREASCIVASSPCQAYSYMAMPWSRAKQIARALRGEDVFPDGYEGYRTVAELNALFEAPRRIQREASEAAGRYIPMIQENVRGAIPWVGRSAWNFGSYHLWGDVPAVMPQPTKGFKTLGHTNKRDGHSHTRHLTNPSEVVMEIDEHAGTKGYAARLGESTVSRKYGSKPKQRKMSSALIARIPSVLSQHIAQVYYPLSAGRSAQPHD